jgi:histone arginine demethylase JMJD6
MCEGIRREEVTTQGAKKRGTRAQRKTERYLRVLRKVKKRARSELDNKWSIHGYALRKNLVEARAVPTGGSSAFPVVDGHALSFAEFSHCIEKMNQPCLIQNLIRNWPAMKCWATSDALLKNVLPKDFCCKVGSDDDGYAVRLKYKYFHRYISDPDHGERDDSPLYIFDSGILQKANMTQDYIVPHVFSEDLLKYAGEDRRPPYQWLCVGGARSGTSIHVDPLGTSAWNALIAGHKRWALFPPKTVPHSVLKPKGVNSAVRWFDEVWPRTQEDTWGYSKPIEVFQGPGEVMFIPSGWWHVVVNLDFTVAVTHNFCSSSNFPTVFSHTRVSRPKMSKKWLEKLRIERPDLYEIGRKINERNDRCSDAESPSSESTSDDCSSDDSENTNL